MRRTHGTRRESTSRRDTPSCMSSSQPTSIGHLRKSLQKVFCFIHYKTDELNEFQKKSNELTSDSSRSKVKMPRRSRRSSTWQTWSICPGTWSWWSISTRFHSNSDSSSSTTDFSMICLEEVCEYANQGACKTTSNCRFNFNSTCISSSLTFCTLRLLVISIQILYKALIMQEVDGDYIWLQIEISKFLTL